MTLTKSFLYVSSLRPRQWVKSCFVLAPLIFSGRFTTPAHLISALSTAMAFCLASSAVYLVNDVMDRERDRLHPTKRYRPIAAGDITPAPALLLGACLLIAALAVSTVVSASVTLLLAAYGLLHLLYSRFLKQEAFVDVMAIAAGFLMRVAAGAAAVSVDASRWMLLTTFFLSLFLGFGKRRHEIVQTNGASSQRPVLAYYTIDLLNCLVVATASLTIITYSLYAVSSQAGLEVYVWTVPLVVFGVFRYMGVILKDENGGDPADVLLHDWVLMVDIGLWLLATVLVLLSASGRGVV